MNSTTDFSAISAAIASRGWSICHNFVPAETVQSLRQQLLADWRKGKLQPAGIGRGQHHEIHADIRGDSSGWLDESDPRLSSYFRVMQTLREALNATLYLSLWELEAHFSVYPVGACYQRHKDYFSTVSQPNTGQRILSTVFYLNDAWQDHDRGMLRLYLDDEKTLDISPQGGTLVLFLSASFYHEVLPAMRERFSIAGWFKQRNS